MRITATALSFAVLIAASSSGTTIRVPNDCATIQDAIWYAEEGDTVLVADGTYTGPYNKNLEFGGKALTVRSESGPASTVIDCEDDGRGAFFHDGDRDVVLDGFTIRNGNEKYGAGIRCGSYSAPTIVHCILSHNSADSWGGGVYCFEASPVINSCLVSNNYATYGAGLTCDQGSCPSITDCIISRNTADQDGGGIDCSHGSDPLIEHCIIRDNSTTYHGWGGGINCYQSCPLIVSCIISRNTANSGGGGIGCKSSSPTITACEISDNLSDYIGGIYCNESSPVISDCMIRGNSATYYGGGIRCYYSEPVIEFCTISENTSSEGGGIFCYYSSPSIKDCTLSGNSGGMFGGGIYCYWSNPDIEACNIFENRADYGAAVCLYYSSPQIADCTVQGNSADEDGVIYCYHSLAEIDGCIISENTACHGAGILFFECSPLVSGCAILHNTADYGAGFYFHYSSPLIRNCTVTGNEARVNGGGSYGYESTPEIVNSIFWGDLPEEIYGVSTVTYSDIEGGWPGEGNIDSDPLFIGTAIHDYRLTHDSPCVDKGDPETPNSPWGGARRDMGACEYDKGWYLNEEGRIVMKPVIEGTVNRRRIFSMSASQPCRPIWGLPGS